MVAKYTRTCGSVWRAHSYILLQDTIQPLDWLARIIHPCVLRSNQRPNPPLPLVQPHFLLSRPVLHPPPPRVDGEQATQPLPLQQTQTDPCALASQSQEASTGTQRHSSHLHVRQPACQRWTCAVWCPRPAHARAQIQDRPYRPYRPYRSRYCCAAQGL